MTNIQHQEEQDFHHSSDSEWDNAEAAELGQADTTSCWVLTDRDVWHRNPFYTGPEQRHPEDHRELDNDDADFVDDGDPIPF
jgi:hypothetical protein